MNELSQLITFLKSYSLAEGFGLNTNILETNLINLVIVIGILIYFGKRVLSTLLNDRKEVILTSIRDAEIRYKEATSKLNEARQKLKDAKIKADEIRVNGLFQIERNKQELVHTFHEDHKRLEDFKNTTLRFEEKRIFSKVKQRVSRLSLEKALDKLNELLTANSDLHERIIHYDIGLLRAMQIINP